MHFGDLDAPAVQLFIHAYDNQQQPTRSLQKHVYDHKSKLCLSQDKIDQPDRIELPWRYGKLESQMSESCGRMNGKSQSVRKIAKKLAPNCFLYLIMSILVP